jgi:general L-amino acid transport system substrate-binding protein
VPNETIKPRLLWLFHALLLPLLFLAPSTANAQATVTAIKQRGVLNCGVDSGIPGFAFQNKNGEWVGFDVDYCRALAAAVLGDPEKVKYVPTTVKARFTILQSGEIDILIRDSSLTYGRNTQLGLQEVVVNFFAGQGFMVRKSLGAKKLTDLNGGTICAVTGASSELLIADYGRQHNVKIDTLLFETTEEAFAALQAGRCDGYTDDTGSLAAARSTMKTPTDWEVLDDVIVAEPLGLHTRQGDENWENIAKWLHFALLSAEEHGITQANVDDMVASSTDPLVRRLLGVEDDFGKPIGLDKKWIRNAIKAAGNYGEIYDRWFGPKALDLPRGLNNQWNKGGLQIAWPWQ